MERINVKPARSGLVVYDDEGRPIPDKGKLVNKTPHIVWRIKHEKSLIDLDADKKAEEKRKAIAEKEAAAKKTADDKSKKKGGNQ